MATLIVAMSAYTSWSSNHIQLWVLFFASIALVGLSVWIAMSKHFEKLTAAKVILTASILCLVGVLSSPILEDDHFRFLWDGYITATTGRPYQFAPSSYFGESSLSAHLQTLLSGINNPDTPTVYGPLLQAVFALSYLISPGELWPLKMILSAAMIAIIFLLAKAGVHPKYLLIFSIHPLLIKESILTAHPDLLIGALVLWATLLWRKEHFKRAVIVIAAASAIKISTAAILLFFCFDKRGKLGWPILFIGTLAIFLFNLPMIVERVIGTSTGIADFGNQWVFNPTLFRGMAIIWGDANARISVVVIFAFTVFGLVYAQRKLCSIEPSIVCAFGVLFLLSPVVNPWYWLWILPLAFISVTAGASISLLLAPAVSLLAYVHFSNAQLTEQQFVVPNWASVCQLLATLLVLMHYGRHYRKEYRLDSVRTTLSP
jgi:alpha-1,6-mannosyltransferase